MAFNTDSKTAGIAIARDETHDLISSDKVEGTSVFSRAGDRLGTISNFMVGKRNGRVEYAVLSFGGLFGMGEKFYPLPWDMLAYDMDKGGYAVDLDKDRLAGAPSFEKGKEPTYDRAYGEQVYGHYGKDY